VLLPVLVDAPLDPDASLFALVPASLVPASFFGAASFFSLLVAPSLALSPAGFFGALP